MANLPPLLGPPVNMEVRSGSLLLPHGASSLLASTSLAPCTAAEQGSIWFGGGAGLGLSVASPPACCLPLARSLADTYGRVDLVGGS